ncbi:MAG TPA: hypothetical protein VFT22_11935 [Kofleriaceae bacterium]|nr:hypothetical protein [Kofleriaceae bacterium]
MTEPELLQDPERASSRAIWLVALAATLATALLVAGAWWFVVPPPAAARAATAPSALQHALFDRASATTPSSIAAETATPADRAGWAPGTTDAEVARAAGARRLERTEWVDRAARVVRIPIDRAIDAVVADPSLIGPRTGAVVGEVAP